MRVPLGGAVDAFLPIRLDPPVNVTAEIIEPITGTVVVPAEPAAGELVPGRAPWDASEARAVVTLACPPEEGDYFIRWVNDAAPVWEVLVPLFVLPVTAAALAR